MPTVPRYDQPQVQETAAPNVRFNVNAPIEAFGGGEVTRPMEALGNLAQQVNSIVQEESRKADEIAVTDAVVRAKQKKMDLLSNEQTGALFQRGQNSFGLIKTVPEEFQKFGNDIESSLTNDRQKALFRKNFQNEELDVSEKLNVHIGRERQAFDTAVTGNLVKTASDEALLNYTNPARVNDSIGLIRAGIMKNAERQGLSGVEVERAMNDQVSAVHSAIIERHLNNGDDRTAKAYFEQNKAFLTGTNTAQVERALEAGSLLGESQRTSDQILARTSDLGTAVGMAKQIEDPKVRQATLQQVTQMYELKKRADNERSENQLDDILNKLETTRGSYDMPPTKYASMKTKDIQTFEVRKAQILSGKDSPPNGADYYNLRTMAAEPALQDNFKSMNLRDYSTKMPSGELSKLIEIQSDLRKGTGKSDKVLGQYRSQNEVINSVLTAHKIDASPKPDSDDAVLVERLRTQVEKDSVTFAEQNGRPPSNEQLQNMADKYMIKATTDKGFLWDTKKTRILLDAGETGFVQMKDIPSRDQSQIKQALKSKGRAETPDNIEALYNEYLNGKR